MTKKMVFTTYNPLMQVKSIAECEHSAVLLTCIKIPNGVQAFVLSIFEWLLKTGFTVNVLGMAGLGQNFLLADLREKKSDLRLRGRKKKL